MHKLLAGIKIVDFTPLLPGPYATKILADLGAEVVKIENPHSPRLEDIFPPFVDSKPFVYEVLNRSKQVRQLDLKNPAQLEEVRNIVADSDVLIEQFRPGTMERLGLGYEQVREIKPKIIYCSITSFGQGSSKAGHDINFLAKSGIASLLSEEPRAVGVQLGDVVGGSLHAVIGILAALVSRDRTGEGRYIDISMTDCLVPLGLLKATYGLAGMNPPPLGTEILDGGSIYDFYRTKDGRYLSVGSIEPKFFRDLIKGLGLEYEGDSYLFDEDLKTKIKKVIAGQDLAHWQRVFKELDACVEPVLTMDEVIESSPLLFGDRDVKIPIRFR